MATPEVPSGWRAVTLAELGEFHKGYGGTKKDQRDIGVPVVRYGDLYTRHHDIVRRFRSFIPEELAENYASLVVGDVLFAGSGETLDEIGKSAVFLGPVPACAGGDVVIFRATQEVDARFMGYASNGPDAARQKTRMGQGSSVMHIYSRHLAGLRLVLPPLPEQSKIAAILSSVDETIEETEAVIAQLQVVKKAMMQELLTRGMPGRHTRFKVIGGGEWRLGRVAGESVAIPETWRLVRIDEVARLESGHTPSRRRPDYWEGDIPWVSLHDSRGLDGPTIVETSQTIGPLGLANSSARMLPRHTVVFSRTATVGKCTVLGREMATSQDFANYVCGPRLDHRYLMHLFRNMQAEWKRLMAGSTHQTIYMPVFRDLQLLLPPLAEQREIAAIADHLDARVAKESGTVSALRGAKVALAAALLSGDLRVTPDEAPE